MTRASRISIFELNSFLRAGLRNACKVARWFGNPLCSLANPPADLETHFATLANPVSKMEIHFATMANRVAEMEIHFATIANLISGMETRFATIYLKYTLPASKRALSRESTAVHSYFFNKPKTQVL